MFSKYRVVIHRCMFVKKINESGAVFNYALHAVHFITFCIVIISQPMSIHFNFSLTGVQKKTPNMQNIQKV